MGLGIALDTKSMLLPNLRYTDASGLNVFYDSWLMHPDLSKERPDLCPPECQLYVLHGDAQSSGEQKLLCVTACNSQVHLVLTWGSVFWRWAAVAVQRLWRCHENNKHQSIAMTGNLKETISGCSDANEFCIDKSNKVTSVTFDMCRPVLFVQSDFSAFYGKFVAGQRVCHS